MQRNTNESFADYKARRAAASAATKNINWLARHGGKIGTRAELRANTENLRGTYGLMLTAHFTKKNLERIEAKRARQRL